MSKPNVTSKVLSKTKEPFEKIPSPYSGPYLYCTWKFFEPLISKKYNYKPISCTNN